MRTRTRRKNKNKKKVLSLLRDPNLQQELVVACVVRVVVLLLRLDVGDATKERRGAARAAELLERAIDKHAHTMVHLMQVTHICAHGCSPVRQVRLPAHDISSWFPKVDGGGVRGRAADGWRSGADSLARVVREWIEV